MIPYGHQSVGDDDLHAVLAVLRGDWLTQGPHIEEFEDALVRATGARFAVAFSHGTAALHGAAATAGLGPGDLVVTSPLTFVASANCARYVGATIGFVDIDPDTLNADLRKLPACSGVVAVHYAGLPADLSLVRNRPRVVIEDASHALGAVTPDGPVGNCARSDMCVFSFHPVKVVTTGEGGAVTTNDQGLAERLRRFRNNGMVKRPDRGGWYYDVEEMGFNYRMTDIQAALGTSQMGKLSTFVERRQQLAGVYDHLLNGLELRLPPKATEGWSHAYHLYPIRVAARDSVYELLRDVGVGAQVHYVPVHWHSTYTALGFRVGDFPEAERAYRQLLSIPMFPSLRDDEQRAVVDALERALASV